MQSYPIRSEHFTAARITALRPGQSPPLVRMPMLDLWTGMDRGLVTFAARARHGIFPAAGTRTCGLA
jgi:hypothetical protein